MPYETCQNLDQINLSEGILGKKMFFLMLSDEHIFLMKLEHVRMEGLGFSTDAAPPWVASTQFQIGKTGNT